jgi:hypothetical protein
MVSPSDFTGIHSGPDGSWRNPRGASFVKEARSWARQTRFHRQERSCWDFVGKLGAAEISIQDIAALVAVFLSALIFSRLIRFVLTEEVLPRIRLPLSDQERTYDRNRKGIQEGRR